MKGLICSAAVASALLAVTTVPSGAVSVFDNVGIGSFDKTYVFTTSGLPLTIIGGAENFIGPFDFKITQGGTKVFDFMTMGPNASFCGGSGCPEPFSGSFLLTVTGTGTASFASFGAQINGSGLTSSITQTPIPGSLVLFLSGLGLLGFWGWTKRRPAGLRSSSMEAAAC